MAEPQPTKRIVRFGVFEADLTALELRKSGLKLRIAEQPFLILAALLERPGEIVAREELRQRIWPSDTFVDFDHSINAAMNKLREALGDSAGSPRYVETVPRRGYRFICPVESQGNGKAASDSGVTRAGRTGVVLYAAVAIALLLAAVFVGVRRFMPAAGMRETVLTPVPLTTYVGSEYSPSFSPDGSQVAFAWTGPNRDNVDIYIKMIGADNPVRLTSDPAPEGAPAWSPDGRTIAFLRALPGQKAGIFLMPAIGGPERKVATINVCDGTLSWHPGGEWLSTGERNPPEAPCAIYAVSVATGEKRRLTNPPVPSTDGIGIFSPDGWRMVFFRSRAVGDLYITDVSDQMTPVGEPRRLTFLNVFRCAGNWTADGKEILFSTFREGESGELWRTPASGEGAPRGLAIRAAEGTFPVMSRKGNRLAYVRYGWDSNLLRLPIGPKQGDGKEAEPIAASTRPELAPQYSPDGRKVAFISVRSGTNEVWVCEADSSKTVQVTNMAATMTGAPRWSPDGQRLVFDSTKAGNFDVYMVSADGGAPKRLTDDPADDAVASWSRDGHWIYFASNRSGEWQVWKTLSGGGRAIQVTRKGGRVPFESPDGRELYYSKSMFQSAIWRAPVGGGEEVQVVESSLGFSFMPAGRGLYYVFPGDSEHRPEIRRLDLQTGQVTTLTPLQRVVDLGMAVSPDESNLLYTQPTDVETDLMLVEGFR